MVVGVVGLDTNIPGIQQHAAKNVRWWNMTMAVSGEAKALPSNEHVYPSKCNYLLGALCSVPEGRFVLFDGLVRVFG